MARVYRHYGIVNEETGSCLEEADSVSQISYWDDGKKITLIDATVNAITEKSLELELEDFETVVISIENIIDWK